MIIYFGRLRVLHTFHEQSNSLHTCEIDNLLPSCACASKSSRCDISKSSSTSHTITTVSGLVLISPIHGENMFNPQVWSVGTSRYGLETRPRTGSSRDRDINTKNTSSIVILFGPLHFLSTFHSRSHLLSHVRTHAPQSMMASTSYDPFTPFSHKVHCQHISIASCFIFSIRNHA